MSNTLIKVIWAILLLAQHIRTKSDQTSWQHKGGECTNFKASQSRQEYLQNFRAGPCSPVAVVPGLMGTGLMVTVDCVVLRSSQKFNADAQRAMDICPFMCGAQQTSYENMVWVTQKPVLEYVTSADYNFVWKNRECASFLFSVKKKSKPVSGTTHPQIEDYEVPGIRIKIYGDTPSTKQHSRCGRTALTSFTGEEPGMYSGFLHHFDVLGYVNGLTMQVIPYDFRRRASANAFAKKLKIALKILHLLSRKRSVVIGHSYGNNMVMNGLKALSIEDKDSLVREFVAVGAPFMGALEDLYFLFGRASWLQLNLDKYLKWDWLADQFNGINPFYAKMLYPYIDALYELIPRVNRVKQKLAKLRDSGSHMTELGVSSALVEDALADAEYFVKNPILHENYGPKETNKAYRLEDLDELMSKFAFSDFIRDYHFSFDFDRESIDANPETPTRIVFLADLATTSELIIDSDPVEAMRNNDFPQVDSKQRKGDGTVNLFSLTLAPLVWLSEYVDSVRPRQAGYELARGSPRTVRFVQFGPGESRSVSDHFEYVHCQDSNDWDRLAQTEREKREKQKKRSFLDILKNGVGFVKKIFDESKQKDPKNPDVARPFGSGTCNHAQLVVNKQFILYLENVLTEKDIGFEEDQKDGQRESVEVSEGALEKLVLECPVVACDEKFETCWDTVLGYFLVK